MARNRHAADAGQSVLDEPVAGMTDGRPNELRSCFCHSRQALPDGGGARHEFIDHGSQCDGSVLAKALARCFPITPIEVVGPLGTNRARQKRNQYYGGSTSAQAGIQASLASDRHTGRNGGARPRCSSPDGPGTFKTGHRLDGKPISRPRPTTACGRVLFRGRGFLAA